MRDNFNRLLGLIKTNLHPLGLEEVKINAALRKVLAKDVLANADVPISATSKIDGYGVCFEKDDKAPRKFALIGQSLPGNVCEKVLQKGEAIKVFSGSHVPENCTAIIAEETARETGNMVIMPDSLTRGSNILQPGAVVRKGEILMHKERFIRAADIGLLALSGIEHVIIYRSPKIGIINIGSELREIYEPLQPGQVRNASQYLLKAKLEKLGFFPDLLSTVYDDFDEMRKVFERALQRCDVVITTGGSSLSKNDLTKRVWADLGINFLLDGINMHPGRNTGIGKDGRDRVVFTLAGNPVSAAIMFDFIVNPGLMQLIGKKAIHTPLQKAVINTDLERIKYSFKILPGALKVEDGVNIVNPTATDTTRSMIGLASGNCYIVLKKKNESFKKGDFVGVIPWLDFQEK